MKAQVFLFITLLAYGLGEEHNAPVEELKGLGEEHNAPVEELKLSNGIDRGEWGSTDLCLQNSWVSSFEVKYEEEGHIDNTGLNAVKLYCQDKTGAMTGSLISKEGFYGEWKGIRSCKAGQFMVGMRGDVMPDQGTFGDDEGLVNLQMKCSDGSIIDGRFTYTKEDKHKEGLDVAHENMVVDGREMEAVHVKLTQSGDVNELSIWAVCTGTNRICGMETEVEPTQALTDDAGLCNIVMYCCASV